MIVLILTTAFGGVRDELVRTDAIASWATPAGQGDSESWWRRFDDPSLTKIVEQAVVANRDLQAAAARADASKAQATGSLAPLIPTVSFDASWNLSPTAARGFQFGGIPTLPGQPEPPKTYWTASAAFQAGLEIDMFLKNASNYQASRFDAQAARGDRDAQVLAYTTRVVQGYLDVVLAKQRVALVQQQLDAHEKLLELMQLRYDSGDASASELLQQRQVVAGARAQLPLAEGTLQTLRYQLAVGLSLPPTTQIPVADALPGVPELPDAGVPADLIFNRPDLRAAESRMDAARSRKAVAIKQMLPTLQLNGQAGWQGFHETETTWQEFWGVGASVHVPLIGGRSVPNIQANRSNEAAAVHSYTQLAANAVLEVESALVNAQNRAAHREAIEGQTEAADLAWQEAEEAYLNGIGSYVLLLNARNTKDNAELALLDSHRQLLQAHIQLHDALGGSWPSRIGETLGNDR